MPLIAGYARCYDGSKSNFPVSDFLFARSQMGMSLAFHIVFAAILFAVGAVSGTVLSFELGLLCPSLLKFTAFALRLFRPKAW